MSFSAGVFSINSTGQPVVTGTVISSTVFNALTADLATGLSTCVLKDGTQTITADIPMAGFTLTGLGAGAAAGESVRYEQLPTTGTTASTFTFNGSGGSTGSLTMTWQKSGNWVTLNIPAALATSGTSSTGLINDTLLPASIRPTSNQVCPIISITNNGAVVTVLGVATVNSSGAVTVQRDALTTAWTDAAQGGFNVNQSLTYFLG